MDSVHVSRSASTRHRHSRFWIRIAVILALAGVLSAPVSAERKIIQNDSFTGTEIFTDLAIFDEQEYVAATFTADPADYPFRIEKVQTLALAPLPGTIAMVSVTVWEDTGTTVPGVVLHTSTYGFQLESSTTALNELDLSCENIVITSGPVRVGLRWEYVGDLIGIAFDLDGITSKTNTVFSSSLGGWWFAEDRSVTGDWILRLEIETNIAGTVFADGFERGDSSCWQAP
jgi:hypothetical protein